MNFNPINLLSSICLNSDCYLCFQSVHANKQTIKLLCDNCLSRLPMLKNACPICAMPLANHYGLNSSLHPCGECLKQSPCYSKTVSAFHYEPPISDFITGLKYNAKHYLVPLLSAYLLEAIQHNYQKNELPQLIIPVPLHSKKIRSRGFNQAQLIGEKLASALKLPILTKDVSRLKFTKAQSSLNAEQRKKNLKGAFIVENKHLVQTKSVAIVDDVVTTGTTANELSLQLLAAGATRVDVWSVARAFAI